MPVVEVHDHAYADVKNIAATIAVDNMRASLRFIDLVEERFEFFAEFPKSASLCGFKSTENKNVRSSYVKIGWPYLIFYEEIKGGVLILRVMNGRRNYPKYFDGNE